MKSLDKGNLASPSPGSTLLAERLSIAVEQGDLGRLWDEDTVPEGYGSRMRELSDLLDPDVEID